jgi:hypothetical protein
LRIIRKRSGPACQWPTSAHGHESRPTRARECSLGMVTALHLTPAWSATRHVPSTRRACGHRPVHRYLTLPWSEGEASPLPRLLLVPARYSAPLTLIAFLSREDLPGTSPLRPNLDLIFTFSSTTEPWGTSPTLPFSPTSATPTPHRRTPPLERRCRGELLTVSFPSFHRPKSDPRAAGVPLGLLPHSLSPPAHRNRSAPPPPRATAALPCFFGHRLKCPRGAGPLGRAGLAVLWAEPKCTVPFFI